MLLHRPALILGCAAAFFVAGWLVWLSREAPTTVVNLPTSNPATVGTQFPIDEPASMHPVERAVAHGTVLDEKIEPGANGTFTRLRLVRTPVQPGLVRVVESWVMGPDGVAVCQRQEMYLADQVIVVAATGTAPALLHRALSEVGLHDLRSLGGDNYAVRTPRSDLAAGPEALHALAALPELIVAAEADGVGFGGSLPNDPSFASQWGLRNTGQNGGTVGVDMNALELWGVAGNTPGLVIAVLDSGLNFTHPDLLGIGWAAPSEIAGDGIDNDGNGLIDDVTGWDFVNNDNDPTDDHGHGSNVTGIIAANRNNGVGIAGLLSEVKILTVKILNSSNSGLTSHLIAATTYARLRGVRLINLSLQNYPFSSSLATEFTTCESAGILLVICAGNQGVNTDVTPNYPSSYAHANIISVGNHDRTDQRWNGGGSNFNPSNYGATNVDLFAPGREILSPVLGTNYSNYTGASQATPFVTAIAGVLLYTNPSWRSTELKAAILGSVTTRPAYAGLSVTGGRLNAVNAFGLAVAQQPTRDTDGDGFSNLLEFLAGTPTASAVSFPSMLTDVTGNSLRLRMPRVTRDGFRLEIETSTDLQSWTSAGVTEQSTLTELVGLIPLTGDPARGFLRVKPVVVP